MPFRELGRLEQRVALLSDYDGGGYTVSELCRVYGISRQSFYELLARRASGAQDWFCERSHATRSCPHRTSEAAAEAVVAVKRRFPRFGPKKVKAWLEWKQPGETWPAASTIGDILKRAGLVEPRGRRRPQEVGGVTVAASEPNAEWACDFKGWFRTADGVRCDPLTITDTASRYLIEVRIAEPTIAGVRPLFRRAFEAHGLPLAIRSDNGPPFGASGAAGLTQLGVWLIKLGVRPRFIRPGSPQDNGRHERMHRTLKDETARPPSASRAQQQARFDAFRAHYNHERPHEALGQATPASLWAPSLRRMPERLLEPWYGPDCQVRQVRSSGEIKWKNERIFVCEPLAGETVGLSEREDGSHLVCFFDIELGVIDRSGSFRRFAPLRHRLREAPHAQTPQLSTISPV